MNDDPRTMPASAGVGKYADWVSLLRDDSAYLRAAPAPAYWALAPYYVGQYTECACSLASAVMVVNAARAEPARGAGVRLVTQQALLDAVDSTEWRTGVGHDDGKGVGLSHLGTLLKGSLVVAGAEPAEIETVPLRQAGPGDFARFLDGNHPELRAVGADEANGAEADLVIDADAFLDGYRMPPS